MPSITFEIEELDYEIAPGRWLEACLSGSLEITAGHPDSLEDYEIRSASIDVCGTKRAEFYASNSDHYEIIAKIYRAIERKDACAQRLCDELLEAYYGDREDAYQLAREMA